MKIESCSKCDNSSFYVRKVNDKTVIHCDECDNVGEYVFVTGQPTSSVQSKAACSANGIDFDFESHVEGLLADMRKGYGASTIGVLQTEVGGKRVEVQLHVTDDENDFCL